MRITTWQQAKDTGLTRSAIQELCDNDLALVEEIKVKLKKKHPRASEKQVECWAEGCLKKKMQREHWGFSAF